MVRIFLSNFVARKGGDIFGRTGGGCRVVSRGDGVSGVPRFRFFILLCNGLLRCPADVCYLF